jgi:hypothetical protein
VSFIHDGNQYGFSRPNVEIGNLHTDNTFRYINFADRELFNNPKQCGIDNLERAMRNRTLLICLAAIATIFAGCAETDYYSYYGSGIYVGTGGASKSVNGIDLWVTGSPPRKFRIIGYITDTRLGGPIAMAGRDAGMAREAKKAGGDGLLLSSDQGNVMGGYSTGSATAFGSGNVITVTGTGVSMPIIQRQARYYVIKYVD